MADKGQSSTEGKTPTKALAQRPGSSSKGGKGKEKKKLPPKTLADVLTADRCMEKIVSHLSIRDVFNLRYLRTLKPLIGNSQPAQEKLSFHAVLSQPELKLNTLLFARPHGYFKPSSVQFYQLPSDVYELHFEKSGNFQQLEKSDCTIKDAVITRPSLTELTLDMRVYRPGAIVAIRRVVVTNGEGVTYGDLLQEAAKMMRERRGLVGGVVMEMRFPVGQKLRMGPYTEVIGALSRAQLDKLGV